MSGAGKMRAAAIILNHGDNEHTLRLTESLLGRVDHILIVDNTGPSGLTQADLKSGRISAELIQVGNNGYARGNNEGIRTVTTRYGEPEYIVISNPDIDLPGGSLEACFSFLDDHPGYAVAAPRMRRADGSYHPLTGWRERSFVCDLSYSSGLLSRLLGMGREIYPEDHWISDYSDVDCVAGSFFVIRSEAFRRAGGFDEGTFLYFEEDILGSRLKELGYREAILNSCSFTHLEEASVRVSLSSLKRYRAMQKSRIYFQKKYRKIGVLRLLLLHLATLEGTGEQLIKLSVACKPSRKENGGSL